MEDKELDELLKSWRHEPVADPDIHQKVRDRIHSDYFSHVNETRKTSFINWLVSFASHPVYATVLLVFMAAITWLATTPVRQQKNEVFEQEVAMMYRSMIDPANSARKQILKYDNFQSVGQTNKVSRENLSKALQMIEQKVNLDRKQIHEFEDIHKRYFNESETLYTSLIGLENEYREFERKRVSGETIDFFKVYHNLNSQKEIYKQALQQQQTFINQVFKILNSEQKGKYGELFLNQNPNHIPSAFFLSPNSEWQI